MATRQLDLIHPGEILREEFMAPLELSTNALALALRVPATASARSSAAGVRSAPTPRCGWGATLAPAPISGWDCRRSTTCGRRRANWAAGSSKRFIPGLPDSERGSATPVP